ncbi:MAG: hypothetical protein KIT15_04950 [Xanthobacteraceae bacterium]|nr:hypothetical protein [Xanthobacteraceae bacterium]MCW5673909.1 hypothetical protein [Xanthobacteraceae bacterium]
MKLPLRLFCLSFFTLAVVGSPSLAQKKVKTETIRDPKGASAEIIRDLSRLPEPVRKKREEILAAARSGDVTKVSAVIKDNGTTISFTGESDAAEFWKKTFPDSEGLEALATLIEILEMPFVQLDKGTPQEMFVWPYFHAVQLDKLTPEQRVELFRLVTAYDFREMQKFGSYNFFRAGIAPDGSWRFFVAGD